MRKSPVTILLLILLCVIIKDVHSRRFVRNVKPVNEGRIVGGHYVRIEDAPYIVYLQFAKGGDRTLCAGSIISETYILTAAHCLRGVQEAHAIVGTAYIRQGGTKYSSTTFYMHPLYDGKTHDYDVGIIEIAEGIALNGNTTKIIKLIDEGTDLETGSNIFAGGWGVRYENEYYSNDDLLGVELPIVSQDECKQNITNLTDREFCAAVPEGGKDTCQGDSGGPAVLIDSGIQAGITSFGYGCGRKGYPGVYANIANSEIRSFIRNQTNV